MESVRIRVSIDLSARSFGLQGERCARSRRFRVWLMLLVTTPCSTSPPRDTSPHGWIAGYTFRWGRFRRVRPIRDEMALLSARSLPSLYGAPSSMVLWGWSG